MEIRLAGFVSRENMIIQPKQLLKTAVSDKRRKNKGGMRVIGDSVVVQKLINKQQRGRA